MIQNAFINRFNVAIILVEEEKESKEIDQEAIE